jgi:predicted ATPase
LATRFVGRDHELQHLLEALDAVARERRLVTVTLCGDPGLGKSRLLAEFEQRLEGREPAVTRLHGRAHPQVWSSPTA